MCLRWHPAHDQTCPAVSQTLENPDRPVQSLPGRFTAEIKKVRRWDPGGLQRFTKRSRFDVEEAFVNTMGNDAGFSGQTGPKFSYISAGTLADGNNRCTFPEREWKRRSVPLREPTGSPLMPGDDVVQGHDRRYRLPPGKSRSRTVQHIDVDRMRASRQR